MITTEGRNHIKRYLAGYVGAIGQSMAFGIGSVTESLSDTSLSLELIKSDISAVTFDFATNKLIFRAPIPSDFTGTIYEVGIFSDRADVASTSAGRTVTTFDSEDETWVDLVDGVTEPPFATTNVRAGNDAISFTPGTSATATYAMRALALDLGDYVSADRFIFAYNVGNTNASASTVKFMTDASNYFTFTMTGVNSAGYKIITIQKGSATVTGAPDWHNITEIQVAVTSGTSGASNITFDAIRVEPAAPDIDHTLVARKVLLLPYPAVQGMTQDVEFFMDITI